MSTTKQHIVFITGAGMSQESGISTFRDSNGLWENHSIEEVASPQGFFNNPKLVLDFYNARRKQLFDVVPNKAHELIAQLENDYEVAVITQNVDDLHERAGSSNVLHLHGELRKVRSVTNKNLVYNWDNDLNLGDKCEEGNQLRPHIVWFGEEVPEIENALRIVKQADLLVVVGTSLQVYPAAGLLHEAPLGVQTIYIDPNPIINSGGNLLVIKEKASTGMEVLIDKYLP